MTKPNNNWIKEFDKIEPLTYEKTIEFIRKTRQDAQREVLGALEKEIPDWLSTSAAHSERDKIAVECFLEHIEREFNIKF